jgi:D-tyrosyl-tRNA(Tyr) deacylase
MRATIQRVLQASVEIEGSTKAKIEKGALIFLGIKETDTEEDVQKMAEKIIHLRFCEDHTGKTNLSLLDINGQLLIISQFTLYADMTGGRRPSFTEAARPEKAIPLYEQFIHHMQQTGLTVQTGEFGAYMKVALVNDGPFTINLDTSTL